MDDRQRKFGIQTRRFRAVRWPAVVLFIFHNFQANSMNSTERFLFVNIPCDYYPAPPLCVLYLFTVWQRRDWGATCCQGNSLRTTSNNPCSVSQRQSYPSHFPSHSQTLIRHSIPSRSPRFFVPRSLSTPKMSSTPLSTFAIYVDYRTTCKISFPSLFRAFLSMHCRSRWN